MAETNIADTLVEYLSSRGVENIFGVLAHTSFAIGDAIAKRPHMRFVNAQHEGGAGNMALGYARATKKPGGLLGLRRRRRDQYCDRRRPSSQRIRAAVRHLIGYRHGRFGEKPLFIVPRHGACPAISADHQAERKA